MSKKPENPPAFPKSTGLGGSGMTLRDWFAGQALSGMMAAGGNWHDSDVPHIAYAMAEAMLAARGDA